MYNPFEGRAISCDWDCHKARGSAGGIDYVMPVGTPLPACSDGVLSNNPVGGTGGYIATIKRPDGSTTQYMHLSKFTTPRVVKQNEIIGYSGGAKGAVGAGSSTGPHCHVDDTTPAGVRVRPFTTEGITATVASSQTQAGGTLLNPLGAFDSIGSWASNSGNWARIGIGTLGAVFLFIGLIKILNQTSAGQAVTAAGSATIKTVKTAAKIAAIVPK